MSGPRLGAMVASLLMAAGAATAGARVAVYVPIAPPVAVKEVRVAAPGPGYVWVAGRWELAPRAHASWVAGHWRHSPHGWYWVEGHWR